MLKLWVPGLIQIIIGLLVAGIIIYCFVITVMVPYCYYLNRLNANILF
jgi:hypothetical protein